MFALATGADVVASNLVSKNGRKQVRLVIRDVREGQDDQRKRELL